MCPGGVKRPSYVIWWCFVGIHFDIPAKVIIVANGEIRFYGPSTLSPPFHRARTPLGPNDVDQTASWLSTGTLGAPRTGPITIKVPYWLEFGQDKIDHCSVVIQRETEVNWWRTTFKLKDKTLAFLPLCRPQITSCYFTSWPY